MQPHPFVIEFNYPSAGENVRTEPKYHAVITTISRSFHLYKVSGIKKIMNGETNELNVCYHITSHPLNDDKSTNWKDAVTRSNDDFVQAIGKAIDRYIHTITTLSPLLN